MLPSTRQEAAAECARTIECTLARTLPPPVSFPTAFSQSALSSHVPENLAYRKESSDYEKKTRDRQPPDNNRYCLTELYRIPAALRRAQHHLGVEPTAFVTSVSFVFSFLKLAIYCMQATRSLCFAGKPSVLLRVPATSHSSDAFLQPPR